MSEDLTPSPALRAEEGWDEGAANAAKPQPETQSATDPHEEAQSRSETAQSAAEPVPSPAGEVQPAAEQSPAVVEVQLIAELAPSPAGEVQVTAEQGQSPAGGAQSPAEQEQFPAEAPSPAEQAQAPTDDTRSSVDAPVGSSTEAPTETLVAVPVEAQPPAEPSQQPDALVSGEPESKGRPAEAARDDPAAPPAETQVPTDTAPDEDSLRLAEALVFASATPVSARALSQLLPDNMDADAVIAALRDRYAGRGVELVETAGGIQFRTAPDVAPRLRKVIEVPRKLPRVAMETLAIIAYHQPCTRAEIEEIRGTSLSQQTLDALLEANLVAPKGRREVPGRPTLWGTTPQFLAQFGLKDIRDLPQRGDLLLEPPKPSGVSDAPPLASDLSEPPADTISAEETGSAALSQG